MRPFALLPVALAALAAVPAATAAYPAPYAAQGGTGVAGRDGTTFVAAAQGANTLLEALDGGRVVATRTIRGAFGIPTLTQSGLAGGLSPDGRTLVLQSMGLHARSSFAIVRPRGLVPRERITLRGTFGFDALSPDGRMLYLIQHTSAADIQHYVVRAYDLKRRRLLPGRIADKTQASWIMQGWAVSRATTRSGRWVYTLYANPGGYPFVHALDTVRGVAHCVGLPWMVADQTPVYSFGLAVSGRKLLVRRGDGTVWRKVDRASWRVTR